MKILRTGAFLLMLFFSTTSCKKEQTVIPAIPVIPVKQLQKINWAPGYAGEWVYSYDIQGRLIKVVSDDRILTYDYSGSTIVIKNFRPSENRFIATTAGVLDSKGRMISAVSDYSQNINLPYSETGELTYDADGYLIKLKRTKGLVNYVYDYTVVNGDHTSTVYQQTGTTGSTRSTVFYTDKNDLSGLCSFVFYGPHNGLFGKPDRHLIKTESLKQELSPTPSWTTDYAYTFDPNGYVLTNTISGTWNSAATYTYQ